MTTNTNNADQGRENIGLPSDFIAERMWGERPVNDIEQLEMEMAALVDYLDKYISTQHPDN